MADKKWAQKVNLKKGALGKIADVTVAEMLANPKTVQRVLYLANVGNIKAKQLMAAYKRAKGKKK
jgi:hypothetical protein